MAMSIDEKHLSAATEVFPLVTNLHDADGASNSSLAQVEPVFSRGLLTMAAIATVLIMVVGVLGNLLTVVALLRCPRVRNVAAAFIISLCVADLLFCLLVLPFSSSRFIAGRWVHGDAMCVMFPLMRYGNVGVSLLSIGMITINRYIMIAHHSLYARIYKKHWIALMIAFCWVFSYGMQLPTLFGVWGQFGYDEGLGTCSIKEDANGRSSKMALFVMAFLVPCVIIVACYARIFWVVHESEKRMRSHQAANTGAKSNPSQSSREMKTRRNEWRITKMVLAIFLSFVICYLPITIVKVVDPRGTNAGVHIFSYIMLYLSACINPIIYVIMNKQYRQAYKTVLLWQRPRLLSLTPAGSSCQGTCQPSPAASSMPDKSKDAISKTMVSHVSIAMGPIMPHRAEELPEVFEN